MSDGYQTKVRPEKVLVVEEIKERLGNAQVVVLTEYRGLTVTELGTLREQLGQAQVEYRVSKNTMARIAARELGIEGFEAFTEGPTAIAYCFGDPVLGAKALTTFAKDHPALVIKGGLLDGRVMTADEAEALARVDPLEGSLAKIAGSLTAPLQAIVGVLQAPLQQLVYVLEQIAARGEVAPKEEAADEVAGASTEEAPAPEPAAEASSEEAPAAPEAATENAPAAPEADAGSAEEPPADEASEGEESTTKEGE